MSGPTLSVFKGQGCSLRLEHARWVKLVDFCDVGSDVVCRMFGVAARREGGVWCHSFVGRRPVVLGGAPLAGNDAVRPGYLLEHDRTHHRNDDRQRKELESGVGHVLRRKLGKVVRE